METFNKREEIADAIRDNRMLAIAGPCSDQINPEVTQEGQRLSRLTNRDLLMTHRRPPWKPRSNDESWKGVDDTDPMLALLQIQHANKGDVPIALEVGKLEHQRYLEHTSFAWIGSRAVGSAELTDLMVGNPMLPVGIKNGMEGTFGGAIDVIDEIAERRRAINPEQRSSDRYSPLLIARGGSRTPTPQAWEESIHGAIERVKDSEASGLIIDVAHGSEIAHDPEGKGRKTVEGQLLALEHTIELIERLGDTTIKGVMIETSNISTTPERTTDPNIPLDLVEDRLIELRRVVEAQNSPSRNMLRRALADEEEFTFA